MVHYDLMLNVEIISGEWDSLACHYGDWRNELLKDLISYGLFYFGKNSIPYKVNDSIYQIKCLQRIYPTTEDFRCVYLQFALSDSLTLEMLNECRTEYMKVAKISYLTSCRDVLLVEKFGEPEIVKQNRYDATLMNRVFYRLNHLKEQTKVHK